MTSHDMKKSEIYPKVTVSLPPNLHAKLVERAEEERRPLAAVVRNIVIDAYEKSREGE